eukprot:gnl/TRDRNA2_/TRDRNA2_196788_c0_seq1.p1 gnl/TRDRNA2_/TRDRNA2_196788_c0~~gnl/TRDRNA2_/TRDRNA2_196788_c0_seq1.p1  ORF type:complete len:373 (+),score=59.47 gnl/TRDRNA2_/TRDRNA2_196788_c0_seq1:85-1203(+)
MPKSTAPKKSTDRGVNAPSLAVSEATGANRGIRQCHADPPESSPVKRRRVDAKRCLDTGESPDLVFVEHVGSRCTVLKLPNELTGNIIGRFGSCIRSIEYATGVAIQVSKSVHPVTDCRNVYIQGTPDGQARAQQAIERLIKRYSVFCKDVHVSGQVVTDHIMIPLRFVACIIGKRGQNIKPVMGATGVLAHIHDGYNEKDVTGEAQKALVLQGTPEGVEMAKKMVELTLLEHYRKARIFNAPLEAKFASDLREEKAKLAAEALESIFSDENWEPTNECPEATEVPSSNGAEAETQQNMASTACPPRQQDQPAKAEARPEDIAAASWNAYYCLLTPWAAFYAADPVCVDHYCSKKMIARRSICTDDVGVPGI